MAKKGRREHHKDQAEKLDHSVEDNRVDRCGSDVVTGYSGGAIEESGPVS